MTISSRLLLAAALAIGSLPAMHAAQAQPAPARKAPPQALSPAALVPAGVPTLGPAAAPVTIVEFFDPACEACRAMYPHVKQIMAAYPKDVRLVIRYTPFHGQTSEVAVRVLEAARQQKRFEPVLAALLDQQPSWASHGPPDTARIWQLATGAGLDRAKAEQYIATGAPDKLLKRELAAAKAAGIWGTPTFFVNGKTMERLGPEQLSALVKSEVAARRAAR